jgi:molybdenum cofactor synthesis domain-containing protein
VITIELFAIGNEILLGDVQDTNTYWLCQQFTGLGGDVRRVTVLGDVLTVISEAVQAALERGAQLIVTTGGLGPTDDDLTLQAVAQATDHGVTLNPKAAEWVASTYQELAENGVVGDAEMTESRLKMARLPQDATPLANRVGAAPGILLQWEGAQIICLPGVPDELKAIFHGPLSENWEALFGGSAFAKRRLRVDCSDESILSPILRQVGERFPEVYIKSRAKRFEKDLDFLITLSTTDESQEAAETALEEAEAALADALQDKGFEILSSESP